MSFSLSNLERYFDTNGWDTTLSKFFISEYIYCNSFIDDIPETIKSRKSWEVGSIKVVGISITSFEDLSHIIIFMFIKLSSKIYFITSKNIKFPDINEQFVKSIVKLLLLIILSLS